MRRAFLGKQADEIDPLQLHFKGGIGLKAARQQDFVDQRVEFLDVAGDFGAGLRPPIGFTYALRRNAQPGQRRAQLVRSVGEQRLMRIDQLLDPLRPRR